MILVNLYQGKSFHHFKFNMQNKKKQKVRKSVNRDKSQVQQLTKQIQQLKTTMPSKRRNVRNPKSSSMGAKIGSQIGDFVQKGATALFKSVTGFGDYKVKSNTLLSGASPAVFRGGDRSTVVRHREYIQDITGSTGFNNTSFIINPANSTTFPWLASIASCYEQYRIHGLIFEYKSTSAEALNSTNTALGTVIMATDYNVLNASFLSKTTMENFEFATSCKPSESMMHPIECDPSQTPTIEFYTSQISANGDNRFVNMGNFQLATVGMQASSVIGELWASFEIELIKPRISTNLSTAYVTTSGTNWVPTSPFGGQSVVSNFGGIVVSGNSSSSLIYSNLLPGAVYMFMITTQGGANSGLNGPSVSGITGGSNNTSVDPFSNASTAWLGSNTSDVDTHTFLHYTFTVNANTNSVTLQINSTSLVLPLTPTVVIQLVRVF